MDTSQVTMDSSMAMILRQVQNTTDMQVAVMKQLAESQQDIAQMIAAAGVGGNIDVTA